MKKLFAFLVIAGLVLAVGGVLACGKLGGDKGLAQQVQDLTDKIQKLEDDVGALSEAQKVLQEDYYKHMEDLHKQKPAQKPAGGTTPSGGKPPREIVK